MNDAAGLFFMGLFYGTTVCSMSCLPYLSPYLLSTGTGFKEGVVSSAAFLGGKLISYSILGGVAAYLGHTLMIKDFLPAKSILGITIIIVGLSIPFINRGGCQKKSHVIGKRMSLFTLGVSTSLIPCPTLLSMFLLAAKEGSVIYGASYGFIYGLGIAVSPLILAGGGLSLISERLKIEVKGFIPYLQGISVLIMVLTGIKMFI